MDRSRWKKTSLAINAMIRGLELDQIVFHYDDTACQELTRRAKRGDSAASDDHAELIATLS